MPDRLDKYERIPKCRQRDGCLRGGVATSVHLGDLIQATVKPVLLIWISLKSYAQQAFSRLPQPWLGGPVGSFVGRAAGQCLQFAAMLGIPKRRARSGQATA